MCSTNVLCPLCSHASFENINSLRISLITAANGPVSCPQCKEIFLGLDKLTIHLFSHSNLTNDSHGDQKYLKPSTPKSSSALASSFLVSNGDELDLDLIVPSTNPSTKYEVCESFNGSDELLTMCHKINRQNRMEDVNKTNGILQNMNKKTQLTMHSWESDCIAKTPLIEVESKSLKSTKDDIVDNRIFSDILTFSEVCSTQNQHSVDIPPALCTEDITAKSIGSESAKFWECDVCAKSFTTKYFLKKHKRLHTGEMPYRCEICSRTFTFQQSYHKHLLYHSDEKPHVCQTCNRAFKELSTLHNHERIHSGEKPFKCEICGKCFRQRVSFLVHTRIHTGVMPYKCSSCEKSFRYKLSLRTHKCTPITMEPIEPYKEPNQKNLSTLDPSMESISNLKVIETDIPRNPRSYNMHNNFYSKIIDATPSTHMELKSDLQNFQTSGTSIKQERIICPSVKFQNLQLYPPLAEENSVNCTGFLSDTSFPQFLYEIEGGNV